MDKHVARVWELAGSDSVRDNVKAFQMGVSLLDNNELIDLVGILFAKKSPIINNMLMYNLTFFDELYAYAFFNKLSQDPFCYANVPIASLRFVGTSYERNVLRRLLDISNTSGRVVKIRLAYALRNFSVDIPLIVSTLIQLSVEDYSNNSVNSNLTDVSLDSLAYMFNHQLKDNEDLRGIVRPILELHLRNDRIQMSDVYQNVESTINSDNILSLPVPQISNALEQGAAELGKIIYFDIGNKKEK